MKKFVWSEGVIVGRLNELDLAVLQAVPPLYESVGQLGIDPAASRLEPAVHRDDAERSAEFLRLSAGMVEEGRAADLAVFEQCLGRIEVSDLLTPEEAESWIRVLTTARLILGARLGIVDDGWDDEPGLAEDDPRVIVLYVLGMLQEGLVAALSAGM